VFRRRGELIPLVGLADALAGVPPGHVATPAYVAVVAVDGHRLGLVVDDLHESEEIVVKPLGALITSPCFGGATILGDGRVALIIDVGRLASELGRRGRPARVDVVVPALAVASSPPMLVVRGRERRYAIPLGDVCRLEQFAVTAIERAGRLEVVQYHGRLLPLVRLGDPSADRATVVVYSDHGHTLGVLVESIVDVFNGEVAIDVATAMPGVRGSAVIDGFATDIVDVAAVAAASGLYAEVS
jgi:two-component system chemotaxis sensor kinase CheA